MDLTRRPVVGGQLARGVSLVESIFTDVPDPDPEWAERNPDRALAFLFVSPRPCAALERLLII